MDLFFKDKVALVAGSSKGLGFATAKILLSEGANVVINGRGKKDLKFAEKRLAQISDSVASYSADVTNEAECHSLINHTIEMFGQIDILITNSGGPPAGKFMDLSVADWRKAVDQSFFSHLLLIKAALPHLQKSMDPSVLAITSFTVKHPLDNLILSNTVRAATGALAKSLSIELGRVNIRLNSILPGWTRTDRVDFLLAVRAEDAKTDPEIEAEKISASIPLRRMASPEEFGRAAAFLVSPAASYINGIMLNVDGGLSRGLF